MEKKKKKLSIVIPVYFNEDNLKPLYKDIKEKIIDKKLFDYELVLVDDGSEDNSWKVINELAKKDKNIVPIKLSRNFGSYAAEYCGIMNASGNVVVTKSADLQEPTEVILEMYQEWEKGSNVVLAVRKDREDKSFFSELYYWIVRKTAFPNMPSHGFDTYMIDRKVVEVLRNLDEVNSITTCQLLWCGFKTSSVYYVRKKREIGTSKWTLKKKVRMVMDTLFSFSTFPVSFLSTVGIISCVGSFIWALFMIIDRIVNGVDAPGYASLFVFQLFSFGMIMLSLGILGNYLWRTFDSSRNRPVYIIEEIKNKK